MARHAGSIDWPEYDRDTESYDEYMEREHEALRTLAEEHDEKPLLAFGAADGYALYRLIDHDPLTVEHVPYADGYHIPAAHVRGLTGEDIQRAEIHDPFEWFHEL